MGHIQTGKEGEMTMVCYRSIRHCHIRRSHPLLLSTQVNWNLYTFRQYLTTFIDIIPLPTVGLRSSVSLYASDAERQQGKQVLDKLSREAQNGSSTSQKLQKTLNDLKELLRPDGVPQ